MTNSPGNVPSRHRTPSAADRSDELCRIVATETDGVCLLAFSRGKDSVGAWIQARRYFRRIIPFHCWLVPGLAFEERSLTHYEQHFGCAIYRVPHPSVSRLLCNQVFTDPRDNHRFDGWVPMTYQDVYAHVAELAGVSVLTPCAVGVRAADSIYRRRACEIAGGRNIGKGEFYPVWDWRVDRLEDEIRREGCGLPVDYKWWGRSFDGLDARFTTGLRRHAPADYERLRALFPMIRADELRAKWRPKHART